ncbi:hypothetical protein BpHYR1_001048 [Brachionus plicatilis]|uniref:Uncharacterized protein n=1 Tax=Brachionus plicatilis TaxID=10195 RepID=A0A3M7QCK0_BRAPC|nr:hypothetical protein BpHYR1_001048 [Brachionus plicatilis]
MNNRNSKINETIAWKSVGLQQLTSNSNFANLNYELDMNRKSEFDDDTAPTLVQNFSFNSHFDFEFPNFDVIDLTQSINKDLITAPPPPEQFSDDYQLNECNLTNCPNLHIEIDDEAKI